MEIMYILLFQGVVDYEPFQSFNTTEDNKSLLDLN